MKHYTVGAIDLTDRAWAIEYVRAVTPMVERHGGRYLARTLRHEQLEGERAPRQLLLLIEWPSRAAAQAFYDSSEYRPYRDARRAGSRGELMLVPGEDVNSVARTSE